MTQSDETTTRITEFVMRAFPLAQKRQVTPDDSLLAGGIIDSMGTLEVIEFLEEEFGLEISDDEMVDDHFESINSIANLVRSKRASAVSDGK